MRYRLKDRELQRKLDEISDGGLSRMLGSLPYYTVQSSDPNFLHFSKKPHLMLEVTPEMLESLEEYDPHKWNSFPDVEPPEDVLMRVECYDGSKYCSQFRFVEGVGLWCHLDAKKTPWPKTESDAVVRFRPWDEED